MSKNFYKLYHYIATSLYPIIEKNIDNIDSWMQNQYYDTQNKICRLFWSMTENAYETFFDLICYIIETILYWIGKTFYPETGEYEDYDYSDPSNFA